MIAIADASGARIGAADTYDAYGQRGGANAGRFQYAGQAWLAEVGLYHFNARAYSATLGRFLQTDPILHAGGMNLYAYVGDDPVNFTDPTGLARVCWRRGGAQTDAPPLPPPGPDDIVITGSRGDVEICVYFPDFGGGPGGRGGDGGTTGSGDTRSDYEQTPNLEQCPKSPGPYDPTLRPTNLPPGYSVEDLGAGRTNVFMRDAQGQSHLTPDRYYQALVDFQRTSTTTNHIGGAATGTGVVFVAFPPISLWAGLVGSTTYLLSAGASPPPVPPGCG